MAKAISSLEIDQIFEIRLPMLQKSQIVILSTVAYGSSGPNWHWRETVTSGEPFQFLSIGVGETGLTPEPFLSEGRKHTTTRYTRRTPLVSTVLCNCIMPTMTFRPAKTAKEFKTCDEVGSISMNKVNWNIGYVNLWLISTTQTEKY